MHRPRNATHSPWCAGRASGTATGPAPVAAGSDRPAPRNAPCAARASRAARLWRCRAAAGASRRRRRPWWRRGNLDGGDRRQLARRQVERDVRQVEIESRLAQRTVAHADDGRHRALAAARARREGRQEIAPARDPHGVRAQLDARLQLRERVERTAQPTPESHLAAERRRQLCVALGRHVLAVASQRELQAVDRPGSAAGLQVAIGDPRILDDDPPRREPVEVERRLVGGPLALAEQPDAAVRRGARS